MLESDYGLYEDKEHNCYLCISKKDNGFMIKVVDSELDICYYWLIEKGELKKFELDLRYNIIKD